MKQILNKLHLIMSEIDRIDKDATNAHQKYDYASEKAIKEAIHPLLAKHKVIFQLEAATPIMVGNHVSLPCNYAFFDVDSGEKFAGCFVGSGQSRDEKGVYAAITGAIKYIMTSTFLIPTGDDPENDGKTKPTSQPQSQGSAPPQTKKSYGDQKVDENGIMFAMDSTKDNGYCWFCDNKRHIQKGEPVVKAPIDDKPDGVWGHRVCYFNMIAATDPKASSPDASTPPDSQGEELPF